MHPSVVLHLNEHKSGIKRTFERSLPGKSQLFAQLLPISSNHCTGLIVAVVIGFDVVPVVIIVVIGFVVVRIVVDIGFVVVVAPAVVGFVVVGAAVVVIAAAVVGNAQPYKSIISLASISVMSKFLRMT